MPCSMNKVHSNYSWGSKNVAGSQECNRSVACIVNNRASSNIAKVLFAPSMS